MIEGGNELTHQVMIVYSFTFTRYGSTDGPNKQRTNKLSVNLLAWCAYIWHREMYDPKLIYHVFET